MARVRIPFPWEAQPDPLAGAKAAPAPVALPDIVAGAGEYTYDDHKRAVDAMARDFEDHHGMSRERAHQRAVRCADRWHDRNK